MSARACLFLLCVAGIPLAAAGAEPLGRLFFTPEQRRLLNQERRHDATGRAESTIRLDGFAARRGETPTVWINGRIRDRARFGEAAALRVGESVDSATQEKSDVVPNGSVTRTTAR